MGVSITNRRIVARTGRGSVPPSVAGVDLHAQGSAEHGEPDGDDHQEGSGEVVIHRGPLRLREL